ncbi:MAG: N-6 DNA methylase, partial [Shewanella sp.]
MSVKSLVAQISAAISKEAIQQILTDAMAATNVAQMGIEKKKGTSVNVERKRANDVAMEILARVGSDAKLLTEEDKNALRKYSGIGGTNTVKENGDGKGHIHEYYTPTPIAEGIWDGLKAMGFGGGNSLEPSAGAGVFQETKPRSVIMTATEIDETSSHVNALLHPEDEVLNQPFEMLAASVEDNTFDSCVGNVPFGSTRGDTARHDPDSASQEIKSLHGYFVVRTIDKVKPNGLIGLVVPNGIVTGADCKKIRQMISMKAEFLGAHRLPSGVFANSGTETSTDVIFLRKHSEDLAELIGTATAATLKKANVVWDKFITGKWFETPIGKLCMHGEEEKGYRTTVKNTGELSNAALKEKLTRKFESRIDYEALSLAEPISYTYIAGDEKVINGRPMRFNGFTWDLVKSDVVDGSLDPAKFGATSSKQIAELLTPLQNALTLSYAQLLNIRVEYPHLIRGDLSDYLNLAASQDVKYREQIVRGCIIGSAISDLFNAGITAGNEIDEVANKVSAEIAKYGVLANAPKLGKLTARGASHLNNFLNAMDKNGNLSEFLQGKVEKGNVIAVDKTDASQLIGYMYSVMDLSPVPYDDFLKEYEGEPISLEQLAAMDDIAVDINGNIGPMDRATSGKVVEKRNELLLAMGYETNQAMLENYQRQLNEIEKKRTATPLDNISMTMNAKWIPRDLVVEYLESVGYDFNYSKVVIDEDGNSFEDTAYGGTDGIFTGYRANEALGRKAKSGDLKYEMQLENYLNGNPVRSAGKKGEKNANGLTAEQQTKQYKEKIKLLNANFKIWIQQHSRGDEVETLYNDTFNGYINIEHSGKPLGLTNTSGKMENFDYQCSEIRRLSEAGTGICGFGTGLGKTATALGLVAYNTQLGRSKRTALVVPKSVLENWFHESNVFLGADMIKQSMFVGLQVEVGKDGKPLFEPVMEGGAPKLNPITGEPVTRAKLKELNGKAIEAQLSAIPQSNFKFVVISKDRFESIPMRPDSLTNHVDKMVAQGLLSESDNKYKAVVDNHKQAMQNEAFRAKYAQEGAPKKGNIPYFEDMGFDNIIVDEGHNYRNSYSAGREARAIQYLPTAPAAKVALDMAIKSQYLKSKYNGRGTVLLTATPTVNSPTDIFNMLSHIMTPEDWSQYGIVDVDDFIRVFGETAPMDVEKLSGDIVTRDALIGFNNLSGLRGIFHRYVNLKEAKDIKETVVIPDIIEINQECDMSAEQS